MKVKKIIINEEDIDIKIKKITLLSLKKFEACKNIIPFINDWWWLRSPSLDSSCSTYVYNDNIVRYSGDYVDRKLGVRPALIFESSNLQIGDRIKLFGYKWKVISDKMLLCDDLVGFTYFRKECDAEDANNYKKSDIKKWLRYWLEDKIAEKGVEL